MFICTVLAEHLEQSDETWHQTMASNIRAAMVEAGGVPPYQPGSTPPVMATLAAREPGGFRPQQ